MAPSESHTGKRPLSESGSQQVANTRARLESHDSQIHPYLPEEVNSALLAQMINLGFGDQADTPTELVELSDLPELTESDDSSDKIDGKKRSSTVS